MQLNVNVMHKYGRKAGVQDFGTFIWEGECSALCCNYLYHIEDIFQMPVM